MAKTRGPEQQAARQVRLLTYYAASYRPGDLVELDPDTAASLVAAGVAEYVRPEGDRTEAVQPAE